VGIVCPCQRGGARKDVGQVVRCPSFIEHVECIFKEAKSPPRQEPAKVGCAVDSAYSSVIYLNEKPSPVEQEPQFQDFPDNADAFTFKNGEVLLSSSEYLASLSDRMKRYTRRFRENGASELVGACGHINDELCVGFEQRQYECARKCVTQVLKCSDGRASVRQLIWKDHNHGQGVRGLSPLGTFLDGASIDAAHTQKAFQLGFSCGELHMRQSINVLVMHVRLAWKDDVSKIIDLFGEP